jgi:hypothetical protein
MGVIIGASVGGGAAVLLLLLLGAVLWRRHRALASTTTNQQPKLSHQAKPSFASSTPLPAAYDAAGDGHAAINVPVAVWQPPSPQQHTTNPLFQPPDLAPNAHTSGGSQHACTSHLDQMPSTATSLTPPAATSITCAAINTTGNNNSSSGNHSHPGADSARGLIMSSSPSADVTALLDAHALGQLHIDWSEIKLAEKPLGRGGFGAVYRGSWQGIKVAVKMLEGVSTSAVGDLRREALMMSRVRHPGIAAVYGLAIADSEQQETDNGHAAVALVMK